MPTRNVVLTDRQTKLIESLVSSGKYQNASEVVREGLRLIEERQVEEAARLRAFREAVDVGFADLERGNFKTFASVEECTRYLTELGDRIIAENT